MRPDGAGARVATVDEPGVGAILDADLIRIDADLRAAGRQAELSLRGRTQPTRWFAIGLRSRLLDRRPGPADGEAGPPTPR
jgi:hypothetical protein